MLNAMLYPKFCIKIHLTLLYMTLNPPPIHTESFSIHPMECDFNLEWKPSAIVQHLTYIAGQHATELGVGFDEMLSHDLFWVHADMKVAYFGYPRAYQQLVIRTWPTTIRRHLLYYRDFEVLDESGARLLAASSTWVIINATTRRLAPPRSINFQIPEVHVDTGMDARLALLEKTAPLQSLLDQSHAGDERLRMRASYSSIDLVGHVNNSRYVDWICDTFPLDQFKQQKLDYLQVSYQHEVMPGEEVSIASIPVSSDSNLWALEGRNLTTGTCAFQSLVRWK